MPRKQRGTTLIELIMTIVVISMGLVAVFSAIGLTAQHSADPLVMQQAVNIGEAYLSEITATNFPATIAPCAPSATAGGRVSFNDVCDYNGLDEAPTDRAGNPIAGLEAYRVAVAVAATAVTSDDSADFIAAADMLQVTVNVQRSDVNLNVDLHGFRPNF